MYYLQSVAVSIKRGGKIWSASDDGSRWMNLGGNRASSACARIVKLSWGMSREQVLCELERFGEVIAIYFEPDVFKD
eukprot:8088461-Karenia_brevis.AAC.1